LARTFPSPWRVAAAFALAVLGTAAAKPAPRQYAITSSGAPGDGQTSNTKAIQNLIDKAAREGGGTLVVPAGVFVTGALFFKQGVNLSIEKGGVLKGPVNSGDYPQVRTRWEGTEREWTSAPLNFTGMTGVELSGEGTVDGSGDEWQRGAGRSQQSSPGEAASPWAARPRGHP
jgi:exo-poly-alpha-galacturonosidase